MPWSRTAAAISDAMGAGLGHPEWGRNPAEAARRRPPFLPNRADGACFFPSEQPVTVEFPAPPLTAVLSSDVGDDHAHLLGRAVRARHEIAHEARRRWAY